MSGATQISRIFQIHILIKTSKWELVRDDDIEILVKTHFDCQSNLFRVKEIYRMKTDKKIFYVTTKSYSR